MKNRKVKINQAMILQKQGYTQREIGEARGVSDRMVQYYLADMGGNVWEWCWDWWVGYKKYGTELPTKDPVGQIAGENRMFRGGGAETEAGAPMRAASHAWNGNPSYCDPNVGFRIVRR